MKPVAHDVLMAIAGAIRNQTYDRCSRWSVARRTMQDGSSYSIEDYPYIEGILDSCAKHNWIQKCTQSGLTEGGVTISMFVADYWGRDVIYYFPTKKMAERFSKTRFQSAINLSEYLKRSCTKNDVEIKQFGNATIHILGAGSVADLIGTSSGRLLFDELDKWTDHQIYQAEQRARGQKNDDVIIWGFSTPGFPRHGINKQFLKSTREHFFFKCLHCREHITLGRADDAKSWLKSFELCGQTKHDSDCGCYLKCSKCGSKLDHETKKEWLATGYWASIDVDGNPVEPDPVLFKTSRGFYLNQLYSPTVKPYVIANDYTRSIDDEDARRIFYNDVLGLPFIEDCCQVTDEQIDDAIEKFGKFTMIEAQPRNIDNCYVTLGVDQGGPIHHWSAVDWRFDKKLIGDPNDRARGRLVGCGRILQDDWDAVHALMRTYLVRMCVIDYYPQPTQAREFARSFPDYVWLCAYNTGRSSGREVRLTEDEYGANLVKCDDVAWMSKTLGRVMNGKMSLPVDIPLEFRRQIKKPVRTLKKVGGIYVAQYVDCDDDHYAHSLNYAEIALKILDPALHQSDEIRS